MARQLGYAFVDLDQLIEQREGQGIPGIFAERGEAYFRKVESEVLLSTESLSRTLISLGGGTPCFGSNMDWIAAHGLSVYLRISPQTLFGRLRRKRSGRPLLQALDDDALRQYIHDSLKLRRPFYERAAIVLDAEGMSPAAAVEALGLSSLK